MVSWYRTTDCRIPHYCTPDRIVVSFTRTWLRASARAAIRILAGVVSDAVVAARI